MNKTFLALLIGLLATSAWADNVTDSKRLLCSASQVNLCFETGECYGAQAWEVGVPDFIVIDLNDNTVSTPKGGDNPRSTTVANLSSENGTLFLQGFEAGRAFSMVIDQTFGTLTGSIARDGMSISVFGICTDADI